MPEAGAQVGLGSEGVAPLPNGAEPNGLDPNGLEPKGLEPKAPPEGAGPEGVGAGPEEGLGPWW